MRCPVCKNSDQHLEMEIHDNGFDEALIECDLCGTLWSINHGMMDVVKDSQSCSFLEATTEAVEGADYC
ncbi:MAG: hypothetical protein OET90_02445 [Desulfuromonadales bacterium]|nr:hypothetical protein [Desulfuromonadales bacterium]